MRDMEDLVSLLRERNTIDQRITGIIHRPAEKGHIAEWIASKAFPIELNDDGNRKGYDGIFTDGDLKGKKVDVKFYPVNEHSIDLNPDVGDDVYLLIFTGSHRSSGSSKHQERQFRITNVYLFNERELCDSLRRDNVKVGVASSVKTEYWERGEIYPEDKLDFGLCMKSEVSRFFCCMQE